MEMEAAISSEKFENLYTVIKIVYNINIICWILGSYNGDDDEYYHPECDAVNSGRVHRCFGGIK
jgi:hypothetical protein